jgi:hypothetical protein
MTTIQAMARARAAYAAADAASDIRDKDAWRAAARAWERLAQPGVEWSLEPLRRDLEALKREPADTSPCPAPFCATAPREAAHAWANEAAQATIAF